ncbi:MAG: hypothetical protein DGJ47_001172 [Rickettsiaceae bacterium]
MIKYSFKTEQRAANDNRKREKISNRRKKVQRVSKALLLTLIKMISSQ